jgi:putative aldouronate transport system permease protein
LYDLHIFFCFVLDCRLYYDNCADTSNDQKNKLEITRGINMKQRKSTQKTILYIKKTWTLYLMLALPVAFALVFRYLPMTNIAMAFKDYNMFKGVWASEWSDPVFKWFQKAFQTKDFWTALRNTLLLNGLDLIFGFPLPIMLALLLNELAFKRYKKFTQTVVYLPHFLSWIIISGIAKQLLAPRTGVVNVLLGKAGVGPINFLMENGLYVATYIALGLWKEMGWNTIIYLAAITGINPELYEAAEVDGASRIRKIWHITLPGIRSTIVVLLIMNMGRILGSEFDRPFAMQNDLVMKFADVLSTYVYRVGIRGSQFSLTAAIGLFQSLVCVVFLLLANSIAKRFGERGIW